MSLRTGQSAGTSTGDLSVRRMAGLRRATLASFVLLVVQYAIGTGVNLYVGAPSGVRGIGDAISKGPAALSVHVVLGLLLVLAAVGLVVQAVIARHWLLTATSVVGLLGPHCCDAVGRPVRREGPPLRFDGDGHSHGGGAPGIRGQPLPARLRRPPQRSVMTLPTVMPLAGLSHLSPR
jgi:hypothetical protein